MFKIWSEFSSYLNAAKVAVRISDLYLLIILNLDVTLKLSRSDNFILAKLVIIKWSVYNVKIIKQAELIKVCVLIFQ